MEALTQSKCILVPYRSRVTGLQWSARKVIALDHQA